MKAVFCKACESEEPVKAKGQDAGILGVQACSLVKTRLIICGRKDLYRGLSCISEMHHAKHGDSDQRGPLQSRRGLAQV